MSLILKLAETYTDKHGVEFDDAYAVVDICHGDKKSKRQFFIVDIYKDDTARDAGKEPVESFQYIVEDSDFDTFFAVSVLSNNSNIYKQAYLYLITLDKWANWESDE